MPPERAAMALLIWDFSVILLFFDQDLIQSGINLFFDQSPPPITFPALAMPINTLVFF